jgi:TonB family protein
VAIEVTIDPAGNVTSATLASQLLPMQLSEAALVAARQWRFSPTETAASRSALLRFQFTPVAWNDLWVSLESVSYSPRYLQVHCVAPEIVPTIIY